MTKIFKKIRTFYIKSRGGFSTTSRLSQRSRSCPRALRCSRLRFQNPNTVRQEWNPSLKTAKQQGSSWILERHPQSYFCADDVPWWWKECIHCKEVKLWPFHWNQQDIAPLSVSEEGQMWASFTLFALAMLSMLTMIYINLSGIAIITRFCPSKHPTTSMSASGMSIVSKT